MAHASTGVSFLSQLRHLDMDMTIHEALLAYDQMGSILASQGPHVLPAFFT